MTKPLHIAVAEALGCKPVQSTDADCRARDEASGVWGACHCSYPDIGPHTPPGCPCYEIARYDTDWSATGPLIEKYGITIWREDEEWSAGIQEWQIHEGPWLEHREDAANLLRAVCRVILRLKEAGKLC